ncbi:CDP-diacylglycerol--glycerol-3-phosphate 3-phosphatidyltransferase [bacterium]|nr:CDP-diacylglycerol--glycerol-3-phosphate 3-phosphatidyltransferase [bacterium]NIN93049.1 CDP-diacylglycerol--glycerol-3-phosphate 3-phosphatidyltransferase [bacterium]NIO18918.1 CDP-diacylglycerol--glycerol-3-phosphate 3-phosphatidyltransferase [bacterium]NIO73999.1 CDP-diacylglycerol--glycerol-3-phosphate 3-phosphatidyltransferase [bacterium]
MTLANKLTMGRIIVIPFFILFMFVGNIYTRVAALIIFILAALTDLYDGIIARHREEVTNFGKFIDPLADKLIVSAAFISFVQLRELSIPAWMVILVISREFIITGLRSVAASRGTIIPASLSGKFKTTSQMVVIITILIILIVNALLRNYWQTSALELQTFLGWKRVLGYILDSAPYWLMLVVTILTVISGFNYIFKNKHILFEEISSKI